MNNCPRCYHSEIGEKDNFCKICGMNLRETSAGMMAFEKVIEDARRRMTKKKTHTNP